MCAFQCLDDAEVHVWCASSDDFEGWNRLDGVLSPSEKEIAQHFRYPKDRRNYELAHGLLRSVLAHYLERDPATLEFSLGEYGKPCLATGELAFNLSHSGSRVAIAVARSSVGVDLEEVKPKRVDATLINNCLTASERRWIGQCCDDHLLGFFRLWTLKEAVLKADGRGLGNGCQGVALCIDPEGGPTTAILEDVVWRAYELPAGLGYCLALAAKEIRNVGMYTIRHLEPQKH